jgi:hypothetical protein
LRLQLLLLPPASAAPAAAGASRLLGLSHHVVLLGITLVAQELGVHAAAGANGKQAVAAEGRGGTAVGIGSAILHLRMSANRCSTPGRLGVWM